MNFSHKILVIVSVLSAAVGCTGTEEEPLLPEAPAMGVGLRQKTEVFLNGRAGRAADDTDDDSRTTAMPETLGVYCVSDVTVRPVVFNGRRVFYYKHGDTFKNLGPAFDWKWPSGFSWPAGNDWPYPGLEYWDDTWSLTDPAQKKNYQFYAYAPHTFVENTTTEMTDLTYDAVRSFSMGKIPPMSSMNYMLARDICCQKSGEMPVFDMRNLSARICMRLKIGEQYSRLRKIRIREITVNDRTENSAIYYKCTYTMPTATEPDGTITLSADGTYTPSPGAVIPVIPIFKNDEGLLLTDKFQQFGSLYCMPQDLANITVNVKYDVYDLEPDRRDPTTGALLNEPIRSDCRASNNVSINVTVKSGYYYNINIVVSPDFLYVLGDNDVVPDLVISPDAP